MTTEEFIDSAQRSLKVDGRTKAGRALKQQARQAAKMINEAPLHWWDYHATWCALRRGDASRGPCNCLGSNFT